MPRKTAKAGTAAAKKTEPKKKTTTRKKGKKVELTKAQRLAAFKDEQNKNFGSRALIQSGDEFTNVFVLRRPSGITSMDIATGGGFPAGGMSVIAGPEGVGKDYLCNRIIANLQTNYGEEASVYLAMSELAFDKKYAKKCGVRVALTDQEVEQWQEALGRKFTAEELAWAKDQVGTFHQVIAETAEDLLEAAAQAVKSNLYQIVVINSFGALLTKAENEADEGIADKHYGGASVPITQFMHRLHSALNMPDSDGEPNTTTILGVNQARDNLGPDSKYNPTKQSGGRALKHGKLVDVTLQARSRIKIAGTGRQQVIAGKEIHWEIAKGKAGCHDGPKGMYPFYFGEHGYPFGADVYQDLITVCVLFDIVQQAGSWLSYEEDGYSIKAQGKEKFAHEIANADLFEYFRSKCFDAAGINFIKR